MEEPKKILVVDDDEDTRLIIKRILNIGHRYWIEEAANGRELKEKLSFFSPDLIILDVKMPGESGYELCMYIRDKLRMDSVKIVAVSGFSGRIGDSIMGALGADDFFEKPVANQKFVNKVNQLLEY